MNESIPLKILKAIFWILERFLISSSSQPSEDTKHQDHRPPPQKAASSTTPLQKALTLFEIESLDCKEVTKESIRKKYKRLCLTYHPDKNKNSPESVAKMQEINAYNKILIREIDKRDGIHPASYDESTRSNVHNPQSYSTEDEPISKEEKKRRKKEQKARKEARQKARRQWEEERRREQEKLEEVLRQERLEEEQTLREHQQRQKKLQKEKNRMQKKYRAAGLRSPNERQKAHMRWITESMSYLEEKDIGEEEPIQNQGPKNLVMEYSTNEIAAALRRGETEIAIELVHNKIDDTNISWFMENLRHQERHGGFTGNVQTDEKLRERVFLNALSVPLDEDMNSALHYAVYFHDQEMLLYLVQEARKWERLVECVMTKNIYGLTASEFAIYVDDKVIQKIFDRLMDETKELIESRKVVPTFLKLLAKFDKRPNLTPFVLSVFGLKMGLIIFETGWVMSLAVLVFTLSAPESPMHQNIQVDPSCLPQNLFSFHGVWLSAKTIYWGLGGIVPGVLDYYYFSIPLLAILMLLLGSFPLDVIFKVNNFVHGFVTLLVNIIPLSKRFPTVLSTAAWLTIYFIILLCIKTATTKIAANYLFAINPSDPMQSDSMQHAMNTFDSVIREEDNDEL